MKDFPGLNRPAIPIPPPDKTLQALQKLVKTKHLQNASFDLFPPLIDLRGGVDVKEEVERELLLGKNVEMAKLLGSKDQKIAQVLTNQFRENQENFVTFYEFMEKLMEEPNVIFKSKLTIN